MRVRIVIAGILAGVTCLVFLWFQYYTIEPARIVPDWPDAIQAAVFPDWTSNAIVALCGVTLFTFGWIAARWNWAENWRASLLAGGSMGIIAGCLIYDFIGIFWFSLKGQEKIIRNFYTPLTEAEGLKILLEAILQTGSFIYLNFFWIVLACAVLGAFGGLASAAIDVKDFWGKNPRKPEGWLFRLSVYMLAIFGFVNIIVTMASFSILWEDTMKSVIQLKEKYDTQLSLDYPLQLFSLYGYLAGLIFTLFPVGITWGWIIRAWLIREKPDVLSTLWIAVTTAGVSSVFLRYISDGSLFSPPFDLIALVLAFLIGIVIGLMTEDDSEGFPYHFSDWLGYGLTYSILGGTQVVIGVLDYAMALVLIAIVNIPHLLNLGIVDQVPADQVKFLFTMQCVTAEVSILASLVIGLIAAGLISFARTVIGIKDLSSQRD